MGQHIIVFGTGGGWVGAGLERVLLLERQGRDYGCLLAFLIFGTPPVLDGPVEGVKGSVSL